MPVSQLQVGTQAVADGSIITSRGGRTGEVIVSQLHGRHFEQAVRSQIFYAGNQAGVAGSVALATTYTGLVLSNPAGSGVVLVPLKWAFVPSVAPAALTTVGLIAGFIAAGLTTHTTPLTVRSSRVGGAAGTGLVDEAATLPTTPHWADQFEAIGTGAPLGAPARGMNDVGGLWVIPAGGFMALGFLTAVTGLGSVQWAEVPA